MSERRTPDATLVSALRILARDIQSQDGAANACIAEAADRLEGLVDERRWISVGERLPELLQVVLVLSSSNGMHLASLDSLRQWIDADENPGKKITHWMPLPPGPEGE